MGTVVHLPVNFMDLWGISDLLARHERLRIKVLPDGEGFHVSGRIELVAQSPGYPEVKDSFAVQIRVPSTCPTELPLVYPADDRIPSTFHRLDCGAFCLGSPTRQRLALAKSKSLANFVDSFVLPYLYSYSVVEMGLAYPFGELAHGLRGILDDFKSLFLADSDDAAKAFVYLVSRPKSKANHCQCPCGIGLRLSKCRTHHSLVTGYRKRLGRKWFQGQYELIRGGTTKRL